MGVTTNQEHLTSYGQLRPWTLGLCIYTPIDHIVFTTIPCTNTEKNFILYMDHTQVIGGIVIGLAYQILPMVSIGASAICLFDLPAPTDMHIYMDLPGLGAYLLGMNDLEGSYRVRIKPARDLKSKPRRLSV